MAHDGVSLAVVQRAVGHANLGIISIYLRGVARREIISNRPRTAITNDLRDRRPCDEAIERTATMSRSVAPTRA
jgi:hypothetical protein